MRPYDYYDEDFDDTEEFASKRTRALHKLVDDYRREERRRDRFRNLGKRHHREAWEWDDDDDYDSFVDDSGLGYNEDINRHY